MTPLDIVHQMISIVRDPRRFNTKGLIPEIWIQDVIRELERVYALEDACREKDKRIAELERNIVRLVECKLVPEQ